MPTPRGLIQRLDQSLHRSNLLPPRAQLLLAVSGGADSVALLHLLHAINHSNHWHWKLTIAHIDHGIRGKSSKLDAQFVKQLAKKLRLPFAQKTLKLGPHASENTARNARLLALHALAKKTKAHAAIFAHHADDQAETLLLRIFRGTGLDGLAGIAPSSTINNLTILRPLLHLSRQELRSYLHQINQPWREDESNATDQYLRNQLRNELLPHIQKLFPKAASALTRLASIAHQSQKLITSHVKELFITAHISHTKNEFLFLWSKLRQAEPVLLSELLRILTVQLGGSSESTDFERLQHAITAIHSTRGNKTIQLGSHITLHLAAGVVTIRREKTK